jgi:hypothetical protein
MHKYTDDGVVPKEGMSGGAQDDSSASAPADAAARQDSAR